VFATFAAIRGAGDGAVRASSVHLASELGSGLSAVDLAARAGVMAAANDLLPAVAVVLPELVPFRRALTRLLHRPIGLSGSGPTLWAVYPSSTDAADAAAAVSTGVADGILTAPGDGPPFIAATTIASTLITLDPSPHGRTDP
jgi:4-diphosphocytidyl-2C-methyl-D-erythritol kinase